MKIFCQFSYGGFKTYRINGSEHEPLEDKEVTADNNSDFPELADLYFNRSGCKLIYRSLTNNEYALIVREIPGIGTDTEGRPINVAVQFIANEEERSILDRLCIAILKDFNGFSSMFADGFSLRGGIHYDGLRLMDFIKTESKRNPIAIPPHLSDLPSRQGSVMLFVPSNQHFGKDIAYTSKVIEQLRLVSGKQEVKQLINWTMSKEEIQNLEWPEIVSEPIIIQDAVKGQKTDTVLSDSAQSCDSNPSSDKMKPEKNTSLISQKQSNNENSNLHNSFDNDYRQVRLRNLFMLILSGVIGISIIGLIVYLIKN